MRDLGERLKKKYSVLSAPSDIRQKTLKEHGSLVSLKGVFGRGRSRACITSWRWRCSGCSVHKEPRWVRQRERRSECNARQTLEKCETFPPIFKLSSRQIIPLQCESWFARSNSRSPFIMFLCDPKTCFALQDSHLGTRFQFHVSLRKRSADGIRVRIGCRPAARVERVQAPSARSKHHKSTLGDPPEARGRQPVGRIVVYPVGHFK